LVVISVQQEHFALLIQKEGNWRLPSIIVSDDTELIHSKVDLDVGFTTLTVVIEGLTENEKRGDITMLAELEFSSIDDFVDKSLLFSFIQARKKLSLSKERNSLNQAVEYWFKNHQNW